MTDIQKQLEKIAVATASKLGLEISTYPAFRDGLKISSLSTYDPEMPDEFDAIMRSNGIKYYDGFEWGLYYKFAN